MATSEHVYCCSATRWMEHGPQTIYLGQTYVAPSIAPSLENNQIYETTELTYRSVRTGTRILVHCHARAGIIAHYMTTKTADGFVRRLVVFREGDVDPYPATFDSNRVDREDDEEDEDQNEPK